MAEIRAVLFDYGGVFTASPFHAIEAAGREQGARPGQLLEIVFGPYDADTDHPWHRLERAEIPVTEAREAIVELGRAHGLEADIFRLLRALGGGAPRADWIDCARELRADGLKTALVTNNVAEFREHWSKALPLPELFHAVVDSSEIGARKPDRRIYEHALAAVGVPAEATVFVDDYPGNVAAARALGMRGVVVEDPDAGLAELRRLLSR